jgi:hypothetical protein
MKLKFSRLKKQHNPLAWYEWYAWRPIIIGWDSCTPVFVWLEYVERRKLGLTWDYCVKC